MRITGDRAGTHAAAAAAILLAVLVALAASATAAGADRPPPAAAPATAPVAEPIEPGAGWSRARLEAAEPLDDAAAVPVAGSAAPAAAMAARRFS